MEEDRVFFSSTSLNNQMTQNAEDLLLCHARTAVYSPSSSVDQIWQFSGRFLSARGLWLSVKLVFEAPWLVLLIRACPSVRQHCLITFIASFLVCEKLSVFLPDCIGNAGVGEDTGLCKVYVLVSDILFLLYKVAMSQAWNFLGCA